MRITSIRLSTIVLLVPFVLATSTPWTISAAAPQPPAPTSVPAPVPTRVTGTFTQNSAVYPYPAAGVQIGQGWDSIYQQGTVASCVQVDAVQLEQSSYSTDVQQVISTYDLATKITTSVSASYNGFGASASGSFNSSGENNIRSEDQNFLFTFQSEFGSTFAVAPSSADDKQFEVSGQTQGLVTMAKGSDTQNNILAVIAARPTHFKGGAISLTPAAAKLLQDDPTGAQFAKVCGDGFVAAIHRGVRIFLTLTQLYASQEQKDSLAASLNASGYGAAASASYSTSTNSSTTLNTLTYRILQQGGIPQAPKALKPGSSGTSLDVSTILPTVDQLNSNPTAFQVVIVPYSNLGISIGSSPDALAELGTYYLALNDLFSLVNNITDAELLGSNASNDGPYEERLIGAYNGFKQLEDMHDTILADLKFLETAIASCYDGTVTDCTLTTAMQAVVAKSKQTTARLCGDPSYCGGTAKVFTDQVGLIETALKAGNIRSLADAAPDFYLKFYSYLAKIPIPRAAYAGTTFSDLSGSTAANANTLANAENELRRAIYSFRILPWRNFFCNDKKNTTLCVTDDTLHALVDPNIPQLPSNYFAAAPAGVTHPPPPPCVTGVTSGPGHPVKNCP